MRAFGIGALCAVIGAMAAAFAASVYGDVTRVSPSDIGWGFVILLVWIPAGALAGLVSGAIGAHVGRGRGSDDLAWSVAIGGGITLAVIGGVTGLLIALEPAAPKAVEIPPRWIFLEYEFRLPAGHALPGADSGWNVALETSPDDRRTEMPIAWKDVAMVDGRPAISGGGYFHGSAPWGRLIAQTGKAGTGSSQDDQTRYWTGLQFPPAGADEDWSGWSTISTDTTQIRTRIRFHAPP